MLQAQYRKISELDLYPDNPRVISDKDFEKLCKSIRENKLYFEARPIILSDRTGFLTVIAGNQRLKAAIEIGLEEVPTVLISGLTKEQEGEILVRDNVSNGGWDWGLLKEQFDDLELIEWGVMEEVPEPEGEPQQDGMEESISKKMVVECDTVAELEKLFQELQKRGYKVELK